MSLEQRFAFGASSAINTCIILKYGSDPAPLPKGCGHLNNIRPSLMSWEESQLMRGL